MCMCLSVGVSMRACVRVYVFTFVSIPSRKCTHLKTLLVFLEEDISQRRD
jgi:hypothetical protein